MAVSVSGARPSAFGAGLSEELSFRKLFHEHPQPMWIYDLDSLRFLDVNQAAINRYGFSRDQFLAMQITEIRPPEDVPHLIRMLSEDRPNLQYAGEWRHVTQDGRVIDVEITSHVLQFDGRRAAMVFVHDVTERKRANAALRESEERYRALSELTSDFAFAIRVEPAGSMELEWVTESYYRALGVGETETLDARTLWGLVHPDDVPVVQACLAETVGQEWGAADFRFLSRSGEVRWVSLQCRAVVDRATGGVVRILGAGRDITEQKRAGETQSRLAAIVESSNDVIIGKDREGIITSWNAAAEKAYGFTAEEAIGRSIAMIVPEDRREELQGILEKIERGERVKELRTVRRRKDGVETHMSLTVSPIRDHSDRIVGASAIARDISEQRRVEENLRVALHKEWEAAERLRAVDQMKTSFLTAVSHELRTPLSSVLGSALTLERLDAKLTPHDRLALLRAVSDNARKLERMLQDLLDLDRLGRGVLDLRREAAELGSLVESVVENADFLQDRRVEVETHPMVLRVDAPKVERILENLLSNAVRYTPPGTPVWVSIRRVPEGALIAVEDVGPGVPDQLRDRIFQPFQQGQKVSAQSPGVGIGLSLVRQFAELHGGRAWVESRPGGGSAFMVLLREPSAPQTQGER